MAKASQKGERPALPTFVELGQALADGEAFGGWFVGAFVTPDCLRRNGGVEVKFSRHEQPFAEPGSTANRTSTSLAIHVSGEFTYFFRSSSRGEWLRRTLKSPGEYAIWPPGVFHSLHVPEKSEMIVVRWPSVGRHDKIHGPAPSGPRSRAAASKA